MNIRVNVLSLMLDVLVFLLDKKERKKVSKKERKKEQEKDRERLNCQYQLYL